MMQRKVIRARAIAAEGKPLEDKLVVVSGKRIESILPATAANRFMAREFFSSQRYLVFPGLVDLHCHGGGGVDAGTLGGLLAIAIFHASRGTTAMMLSVLYDGPESLSTVANLLQAARAQAPLHLLGIHLEGPFINPEARGSIPETAVRPWSAQEARKILSVSQDELRMITIAPELPGALEAIALFRKAGVLVAMGHSLATAAEARMGAEVGATMVTHLGNAMRPFHQREPGLVGEGLANPRLTTEIIGDGFHLAPQTLGMFLRAKVGDLILVSDCRWVGGLPEGSTYIQNGEPMQVRDGAAYMGSGTLAGGIYPLWKGVTTLAGLPGCSIWEAARLAGRNPAKVLGKKSLGRIGVGGRADLVLAGPDYTVQRVLVGGVEVVGTPGG